MNPDQDPSVIDPNLNTAVGASEYLDKISAKPKGGKFLDKKMLFILGGLLVVIIIVIAVVASSSGKNTVDVSSVMLRAKTQYDNAMVVIKYGNGNLSSGPVARNNAIASLVVGTHASEMSVKVGGGKMSKEAAATLRDPKAAEKSLKEAKDAGRLDSEYKDTIGLFLDDIIKTLSTIGATEGVTAANKEMAAKYIEELEIIKDRLEKS